MSVPSVVVASARNWREDIISRSVSQYLILLLTYMAQVLHLKPYLTCKMNAEGERFDARFIIINSRNIVVRRPIGSIDGEVDATN
jgi:hypothetical protein